MGVNRAICKFLRLVLGYPHGRGGDPNANVMNGTTMNYLETARVLLSYGERVDAQVVEVARLCGLAVAPSPSVRGAFCLSAGADPNLPDQFGPSPLMGAKSLAIAKLLLRSGANPAIGTKVVSLPTICQRALGVSVDPRLCQEHGRSLQGSWR